MFCTVSSYNFSQNSAYLSKILPLCVVKLPSSSFSNIIITLHSSLVVAFLRPFPVSTAPLTLMVIYSLMSSLKSSPMVLHISEYSIFVSGIPLSIASLFLCCWFFVSLLSLSFFCYLNRTAVSKALSCTAYVILLTTSSSSSSPSSLSTSKICCWNSSFFSKSTSMLTLDFPGLIFLLLSILVLVLMVPLTSRWYLPTFTLWITSTFLQCSSCWSTCSQSHLLLVRLDSSTSTSSSFSS